MIATREDRHKWIGGSESSKVDANYDGVGFKKWWRNKLLGRTPNHFSNYAMNLGTILEHEISDAANFHGMDAQVYKEGTMARVNLDGYSGNDAIAEVKTAVTPELHKWLRTKKRDVPSTYRKQARHAMYVTGLNKARIAVFPLTEWDYNNPLRIEVNPLKLVWFEYTADDFDIELYDKKIKYLTYCYENYLIPQNDGWNLM